MTDKVIVDKDYRPVPEGSPDAAFSLRHDDPRLPQEESAPDPQPIEAVKVEAEPATAEASPEPETPDEEPAPRKQASRKR
jgi:hypothetical protein